MALVRDLILELSKIAFNIVKRIKVQYEIKYFVLKGNFHSCWYICWFHLKIKCFNNTLCFVYFVALNERINEHAYFKSVQSFIKLKLWIFVAFFEVLQQVIVNKLLFHLILKEWLDHCIKVLSVPSPQIEIELMTHVFWVVTIFLVRCQVWPIFDKTKFVPILVWII